MCGGVGGGLRAVERLPNVHEHLHKTIQLLCDLFTNLITNHHLKGGKGGRHFLTKSIADVPLLSGV